MRKFNLTHAIDISMMLRFKIQLLLTAEEFQIYSNL